MGNMMVLLTILILLSSCASSSPVSKFNSDIGLNTTQMIENQGYLCENHQITTEDGYILTYQRIPQRISNDGYHKSPILLMHGLLVSSSDFVNMGPDRGLAYILSDQGYDVWLANSRGNSWSRRHTTLDVFLDNRKFYSFSWHEIGYYDLPAAIDYILNVTKREDLYYIGHSQGGTSLLVLASTRPEYNKKIKLASLLAPASFMENFSIHLLKNLCVYIYEIEMILNWFGIYEIPFVGEIQRFLPTLCARPEGRLICRILSLIFDNRITQELEDNLAAVWSNTPSNCAIRQILHYSQLIRNGGFSQYDHGIMKNLEIYGRETPPSYDLSKISAPVAVFYSLGDPIVNHVDIKRMIRNLPNVVYDYLGPHELGHREIVFFREIVDPVEGILIKVLRKYR